MSVIAAVVMAGILAGSQPQPSNTNRPAPVCTAGQCSLMQRGPSQTLLPLKLYEIRKRQLAEYSARKHLSRDDRQVLTALSIELKKLERVIAALEK